MRPMAERVRGALFSALGDIEGLTIFDAYGGSGAVGFEALSRGAKFVQITEIDGRTQKSIKSSVKKLKLQNIKVTRANCISWLKNNEDRTFDVIIADPPYDQINPEALGRLLSALSKTGLLVVSHAGDMTSPRLDAKLIDFKNYGDASLSFYKVGSSSVN